MLATVERGKALNLLRIEHREVAALIGRLGDEEMTRRDTIRHGLYYDQECSFKDLLAHLICYEALTIEAVESWRRGQKHWVIDAVNDSRASLELHYGGISERAHLSLGEQIAEYQERSVELEGVMDAMSDAEWREAAPFSARLAMNLGGMIESIMVTPPRPMYRHLPVHIPDADAYVRRLRAVA